MSISIFLGDNKDSKNVLWFLYTALSENVYIKGVVSPTIESDH